MVFKFIDVNEACEKSNLGLLDFRTQKFMLWIQTQNVKNPTWMTTINTMIINETKSSKLTNGAYVDVLCFFAKCKCFVHLKTSYYVI